MLHGHLHALAPAGLLALVEGGQDAGEGVDAGARVADLCPRGQRRPVFEAGAGHRAAHRLGDHLVGLEVGVAPRAEALDRGVDQPGVELLEPLPGEAHPVDGPGAEVLHEDVGLGDQLGEDLLAALALHVEGDASLVAVQHREVEAVDAGDVAQLLAGDVARGRLQLDHVSAEPGQELGAGRTRLHMGHVEDADTIQCLHGELSLTCTWSGSWFRGRIRLDRPIR